MHYLEFRNIPLCEHDAIVGRVDMHVSVADTDAAVADYGVVTMISMWTGAAS